MPHPFPWVRPTAALVVVALISACSPTRIDRQRGAVTVIPQATYAHAGFGPGPELYTGAAGRLVEERRTEPFGIDLDGADLVARDLNALNQRTDAATGWSDHGARWMVPDAARWLTPDPPVEGPEAGLMAAPWKLHPYQYVSQNPILYWDPDGQDGLPVAPNQPPVWTPPPPPAAAAPAAAEAVATESWLGAAARYAVRLSPIAIGVSVFLWPRTGGSGATCDGPTACGKGAPTRTTSTQADPSPDVGPRTPGPGDDDNRRRRVIVGFHGTPGDNILSILDSGVLRPSGGKIFLSELNDVYQHGADVKRGAAFSIFVVVDVGAAAVVRTSVPGNPRTIIIETALPLPAHVETLQVRTRGEEGGFFQTVVSGAQAIRDRLR